MERIYARAREFSSEEVTRGWGWGFNDNREIYFYGDTLSDLVHGTRLFQSRHKLGITIAFFLKRKTFCECGNGVVDTDRI